MTQLNRLQMRKKITENLGDYPTVDKLAAAITDTTGLTFTCTDKTKFGDGSWLELPSGEVVRVNGTPTTDEVTLLARGMRNTTAATQAVQTSGNPDLGIVRINPKWFSHQMNDAINDCLSNRVLKVVEDPDAITIVADTTLYTLPAAIKIDRMRSIGLYDSSGKHLSSMERWTPLCGSGASGEDQIRFHRQYPADREVHIDYYAGFAELADDSTVNELPDNATAQLVPIYWSLYTLLQQLETPRLKKDRGTFKRRGTPFEARLTVGRDWLVDFTTACASVGLHANIPGVGVVGPRPRVIGV